MYTCIISSNNSNYFRIQVYNSKLELKDCTEIYWPQYRFEIFDKNDFAYARLKAQKPSTNYSICLHSNYFRIRKDFIDTDNIIWVKFVTEKDHNVKLITAAHEILELEARV